VPTRDCLADIGQLRPDDRGSVERDAEGHEVILAEIVRLSSRWPVSGSS
jgi:hypothetical protein